MTDFGLRLVSTKVRITIVVGLTVLGLFYLSFTTFDRPASRGPPEHVYEHERDVSTEKYITLLAPSSPHPWDQGGIDYYFETVMIMAHRLLLHRPTRDMYGRGFIVVATEHVKPKQVDLLREIGAEVRVVSALPPPSNVDPANVYDRWKDQYTKLLLWNMTEYDRLVYIDADAMIIKPISELFDVPPVQYESEEWLFASVYDAAPGKGFGSYPPGIPELGPEDKWGYDMFSGGQFVIMPTKQQSEYVFSIYHNPPPDVDFHSTMEQSFLRYAYRDGGPYPWVRLSQIYNTQWPRAKDMRASKIIHEKSWSGGPNHVEELADEWYRGWGAVQAFLARKKGLEYYKQHIARVTARSM
jgi:alpha-N-acetylglucosamine transferase